MNPCRALERAGYRITLLPADATGRVDPWFQQLAMEFSRMPDSIPPHWRGLIGEFGPDTAMRWIALC